jgi:hypothetical protein
LTAGTGLRNVVLLAILIQAGLGQASHVGRDQSFDGVLERPVPGDDIQLLTATDAFVSALNATGIQGGAVMKSEGCHDDPVKQSWRPMGRKLRDVLDSIVWADGRYKWEKGDGVVNLLPVDGEPELLKTPILEFHADNVLSAREALGILLSLPDVKKRMTDLNLKRGLEISVTPHSLSPKKVSIECKDTTLRGALNAIARAEPNAIWEYFEFRCAERNEVLIRF